MIEEINEKLHRGGRAIVRRAIEYLYLDLKRRGLLRDSANPRLRGSGRLRRTCVCLLLLSY